MKSIRSLYKIGNGPSSSHTVGPYRAAELLKKRYPKADYFRVTLFGSLAMTGEGHGTDRAIKDVLPNAEVIFDRDMLDLPHPNTMRMEAYAGGSQLGEATVLSVGGGEIHVLGEEDTAEEVYPEKNLSEILELCEQNKWSLPTYVYRREGTELHDFLRRVWRTMEDAVERGLKAEGILPGVLRLEKKAKRLFSSVELAESPDMTFDRLIAAFSYACCEENADGHLVVTAPTCGSCGVLPAVLYYMRHYKGYTESRIVDALATAGIIGNVIRTNASISGAECGCQAEIGSACSMAAAAFSELKKMNLRQIEYAAEVAMEHNLGLTCDPVEGLVQIPCIERNAVAAMRAVNASNLAQYLYLTRRVSFDEVVEIMYRTGLDLNEKYRETAHGGLARLYKQLIKEQR